jgi:hypothetical protein
MRIRGVGDSRGLPAITVDSGNELVMAQVAVRGFRPQREPIYFVGTVRSAGTNPAITGPCPLGQP